MVDLGSDVVQRIEANQNKEASEKMLAKTLSAEEFTKAYQEIHTTKNVEKTLETREVKNTLQVANFEEPDNPENKDSDTIIVTVDDLLRKRTVVIKVKEGQVILFKTENQEKLIQSRIYLKFWERQEGKTNHLLHTKNKIIFGKKTANENISVTSPVTGQLEIKLRNYGWIVAVVSTGAALVLTKRFFL